MLALGGPISGAASSNMQGQPWVELGGAFSLCVGSLSNTTHVTKASGHIAAGKIKQRQTARGAPSDARTPGSDPDTVVGGLDAVGAAEYNLAAR